MGRSIGMWRLVASTAVSFLFFSPFVCASSGGAHTVEFWPLAFKVANFAIFFVIIVVAIRKLAKPRLAMRRQSISQKIQEAHEALAKAEEKLQEMKLKWENAEHEVSEIKARLDGETERQGAELIARSREGVEKLVENSRRIMEYEKEKLLADIKHELVHAVMGEVVSETKERLSSSSDEAWVQRGLSGEEVPVKKDGAFSMKNLSRSK